MNINKQELENIKQAAVRAADSVQNISELEEVRIKYLSRKGIIPRIMENLKNVEPEQRPIIGKLANQAKQSLSEALSAKTKELNGSAVSKNTPDFDPTLPGRWPGVGTRHPISQIVEQSVEIFSRIGFTIADGPDIETEYYNFDALNTPANHPSRDIQDTFWLDNTNLLRTQTSPVQIRVMEKNAPPIRIIAPGRCYRRDTTDATHSANFHQIEGLYVDKNVSLTDLKSDITYFAHQMIGKNVKVRFRPHFFPFTEPSVEYDFSCHVCHGKGCRVCKNSGWIEISGAGIVHPKVFNFVGYDNEAYTGYAFGLGVERLAMIKFGINDIRLLYDNDLRFLKELA
jgi:phenylalanyl-tRNA synthetase alpha chain